MTVDNDINGSLLKIKRESLGWTLADMAVRACLSTKQVRQLEEGGDNSFYSHAIKLTVAKKIALILNIEEDELFFRSPVPVALSALEDPLHEELEHEDVSVNQIPKEPIVEKISRVTVSKDLLSGTEPAVSFASILTRSQSPTEDLDALLAHEEEAVQSLAGNEALAKTPIAEEKQGHVALHSPSEFNQAETTLLPSTPSPITLSSASSSLSEDQSPNGQSVWVKLILGILVFIGALLIVAPKSLDGLVGLIEGGFKKMGSSIEPPSNPNIQPAIAPPVLDTTQVDTPVESAKAVGKGLDTNNIPLSSTAPAPISPIPVVNSSISSPVLPSGNVQVNGSTSSPVKTPVPSTAQVQQAPAATTTPPGQ